ncbi:unnamed protein product [Rotaria socialis]|uniref:UAS domain-containing protein n=1 Tax=Rotaria socialis TaxID=392032 RepID=A0A817TLZ2_9BILA|nr:unnamed protein product [Rotaria socialis]
MEYPNDVAAIESISKCFHRRYDACPVFYMGSFTKACQAAFSPTVIEERRPVLVYVHHDGSMLDNIFCNRIFCSTTIIEYLLENYIVWPCDVTLEGNRNRTILDRFCLEILPKIHDKIEFLNLESSSMKRILLLTNYSNLYGIGLYDIATEIAKDLFTEFGDYGYFFLIR